MLWIKKMDPQRIFNLQFPRRCEIEAMATPISVKRPGVATGRNSCMNSMMAVCSVLKACFWQVALALLKTFNNNNGYTTVTANH